MCPMTAYVSGSGAAPVVDSWKNRTQIRADARNTPLADLDPLDEITLPPSRYTAKCSAVFIDAILTLPAILVCFRGHLALFTDDGAPLDSMDRKDGWVFAAQTSWNQLVKTGANTARLFYTSNSVAYRSYRDISVSSNTITLGPEVIMDPVASGGVWNGERVQGLGIVAHKHLTTYIGGDVFANAWDAGIPSPAGDPHAGQLFDSGEGGQTENLAGAGSLPLSDWFGGGTNRIIHNILYDSINDGFHPIIGDSINFVEQGPSLTYVESGNTTFLSNLFPTILSVFASPQYNEFIIASDGKLVVATGSGRLGIAEFALVGGYTLLAEGATFSAQGSDDRALEFGLWNPCIVSQSTHTDQGGNFNNRLLEMGTANGNREFVSLLAQSGVFTRSSTGVLTPLDTIEGGDVSFITEFATPAEHNQNTCNQTCTYFERKDDDTIYAFTPYLDIGSGQIRLRGGIIRK